MAESRDMFYLNKVFPEPDKIFSASYKSISELFSNSVFVFDTNALLVPFDTSEKNLNEIKKILLNLKQQGKIYIPARVAREFAKNRATKLGDLFLSLRQLKNGLNSGTFKINEYPLLDGVEEFPKLKESFAEIQKEIKSARALIDRIEEKILGWTWNDNVSLAYQEIFTSEVIFEPTISEIELEADLKFRYNHKIAPGFKDSNKIDDGIGDLIIWHTILEIGKNKKSNIIFISNDEKNDWFHKQDKIGMYPRFELFDEFRRITGGNSFAITSFVKFLELSNAKEETISQVKQSIAEHQKNAISKAEELLKAYPVGLQVRHAKFGLGIISAVSQVGSHPILEVNFHGHGIKKIMAVYAKLETLDTPANIRLLSSIVA